MTAASCSRKSPAGTLLALASSLTPGYTTRNGARHLNTGKRRPIEEAKLQALLQLSLAATSDAPPAARHAPN